MVIKKIFNNNVAAVVNDKGHECVIVGKGIIYGKRVGDSIDETHAVKVFKSAGQGLLEKLSNIVEDIPFEHIKVCNEIVTTARRELGQVDDKIFLTLINHISFAIQRHNEGMEFADTLWETQRLYPNEYRVGLMALDIIDNRLGIRLPAGEATFIAFHLLNANGTSMHTARKTVKLIDGVLDIVRRRFRLNEDSILFTRFMTHLRFFAGRVMDPSSHESKPGRKNELLLRLLDEQSEERTCVEEIADFVQTSFRHTVLPEEKSYLLIHLHTVVNEAD